MPSLKLSDAGSAGPSLAQASPSLSSFLTLAVFQRGGASQRPTVAPAGTQTRDLRLLKTLKTATVASTPLAIW
jgi:hypothetical protein